MILNFEGRRLTASALFKEGRNLKRTTILALVMSFLLSCCSGNVDPTPTPDQSVPPTPTPTPTQPAISVPTPNNDVRADRTIFAMDTVMELRVHGDNAAAALQLIIDEINSLERTLSVTREGSDVWKINHAGGEQVKVGRDASYLLELARILGEQTGGALDVTMYPVVKAWGFTTSEYRIPDETELQELLERVDYEKIEVVLKSEDIISSDLDAYVTLPVGMEMDLGSIAKGYAGERAADLLRENGVTSALLNMGGNVQSVGAKPDGTPWRIGIRDPHGSSGSYLGVVELIDQAAVTSGGYERYFEEDGVRYWHIMDPATGAPARSGLVSVTIIGDRGSVCDGLSTSLFVLGVEGALDYWRTYGDFEAILVDEDNNVWITAGLKDCFTLVEGTQYTLRIVEE